MKGIIFKKVDKFSETLEADLKFAERTEEAWKRYEQREFKSLPLDKFLHELEKC